MPGSQLCSAGGNLARDRLDLGREIGEESIDGANRLTATRGRNEAFGVNRCRRGEGLASSERSRQSLPAAFVMDIVRIQDANDATEQTALKGHTPACCLNNDPWVAIRGFELRGSFDLLYPLGSDLVKRDDGRNQSAAACADLFLLHVLTQSRSVR